MNGMTPSSNFDAFEPVLKESINQFLAEYEGGTVDFSNFTSIFSRFLHNLPDPPLHVIWFYAALNFHSANFTTHESSNQVSVVKDLFQLLVSCSSPYNAAKNIAVLAPVISQLYSIAAENCLLRREILDLLEGIVSYISLSCGEIFHPDDELEGLDSCFMDLVHVWMVGKIGDNCEVGEGLRLFFPIASDGVRNIVLSQRFGVGYVSGIVMSEAFLLRLCLKFGCGIPREELRSCTVQMITAFSSVYFTDNILRMLLEQVLPVMSLLNPADEIFLREVLYDAVISMEYLLLGPQKGISLNGETARNLAVTWLFFVDNAIRFAREHGDKTQVSSYLQAFLESCLPPELVKWVMSQHSLEKEMSVPNISTPVALISEFSEWLLIAEDQGVKVFDSIISITYARNIFCKSTIEYELPPIKYDGMTLGDCYLRYSDSVGNREAMVNSDLEMIDSIDNMPSISPGLKALPETNDTRKRRERINGEMYKSVKFLKCNLTCNSSRERIFLFGDDGLSVDTEMCSPLTVTEKEHMQQ